MAEPDASELPIFELGLAIVPTERVPLHIFEERYRAMIGDCLERETPFGIVFRDDDGARAIGCTALVSEVLERYDDGRLDMIVRGGEPFRVLDRFDAPEWPAAQVEMIEPTTSGEAGDELSETRTAFAALLEAVGAEPQRAEKADDAFTIAAQVELPGKEKQRAARGGGRTRAADRARALPEGAARRRQALARDLRAGQVERARLRPDRPATALSSARPVRRPRRRLRGGDQPRRGACRQPRRPTAWAPPKNRLSSGQRVTSKPRASSRSSAAGSIPGSAWTIPSS